MSQYTKINLAARPEPGPITHDLFDIVTEDAPTVGQGEVLIRQTHMSLDPAMIGWMSPDEESYVPPVGLGEVMRSSGIGQVVESQHVDFARNPKSLGQRGVCGRIRPERVLRHSGVSRRSNRDCEPPGAA